MAAGKTTSLKVGVVVGVDGLRRHAPLAAVGRAAEALELALPVEGRRARHVAEGVARLHLAAPSSRATCPDSRSWDERRRASPAPPCASPGVIHGSRAMRCAVGGAQVLDQRQHLLLRGGRKVALHVQLARRLAEPVVHRRHGALPARAAAPAGRAGRGRRSRTPRRRRPSAARRRCPPGSGSADRPASAAPAPCANSAASACTASDSRTTKRGCCIEPGRRRAAPARGSPARTPADPRACAGCR